MSEFELYFRLGFGHLYDWQGLDHIAYIMIVIVPFTLKDYKKIFLVITGFTIGHSITLSLLFWDIKLINSELIELLIPITILLTSVFNLVVDVSKNFLKVILPTTVFFGLIHGLGFSNTLQSLLIDKTSIVLSLFGFNLGIEVAQLSLVIILFSFSWLITFAFKLKHDVAMKLLSVSGCFLSIYLIFQILK